MSMSVTATTGANPVLTVFKVLAFAALLAPISLRVADDGVSANYAFALLILLAPGGYRRNDIVLFYVILMLVGWGVGMLQFSGGDGAFLLRQAVSFGLALAGPLLLFVRLRFTLDDIASALVLASITYAAIVFLAVATNGLSLADVYFIKGALREYVPDWPQRFVVILIPALFIAYQRLGRGALWPLATLTIAACIFLTFTRAAWIGILIGAVAYALAPGSDSRKRSVVRPRQRLAFWIYFSLFVVAVIVAARSEAVIKAVEVLWDNMATVVSLLGSGGQFEADSSEGTRLQLWAQMLEALAMNPITGTGFAGVYLVVEGTDSAHSQYMDVLLRSGFVGLGFYLYFWAKLLRGYAVRDRAIFAGLVALFVFGFFHETTKLSYGALLFFALLSKLYEAEWDERRTAVATARPDATAQSS